jgi:hypothetical protein
MTERLRVAAVAAYKGGAVGQQRKLRGDVGHGGCGGFGRCEQGFLAGGFDHATGTGVEAGQRRPWHQRAGREFERPRIEHASLGRKLAPRPAVDDEPRSSGAGQHQRHAQHHRAGRHPAIEIGAERLAQAVCAQPAGARQQPSPAGDQTTDQQARTAHRHQQQQGGGDDCNGRDQPGGQRKRTRRRIKPWDPARKGLERRTSCCRQEHSRRCATKRTANYAISRQPLPTRRLRCAQE